MTDIETMTKALRLACAPRLLQNGQSNWQFAPDHFFKSLWRTSVSFDV